MANCLNCGRKLGCSCQRKTASDGKSVCATCISNYEKILVNLNKISGISEKKENIEIINVQVNNIKNANK